MDVSPIPTTSSAVPLQFLLSIFLQPPRVSGSKSTFALLYFVSGLAHIYPCPASFPPAVPSVQRDDGVSLAYRLTATEGRTLMAAPAPQQHLLVADKDSKFVVLTVHE